MAFYKIVGGYSLFTKTQDINDINSIQEGTCFTAEPSYDLASYKSMCPQIIRESGTPMIFFAEGAFNTMLWWPIFSKTSRDEALAGYIRKSCIYEIVPVTPVIKDRSINSHNICRCCANKIKFKNQVPVDQIAQLAIDEYHREKFKLHWRYGSAFVKSKIALWQQGKYI